MAIINNNLIGNGLIQNIRKPEVSKNNYQSQEKNFKDILEAKKEENEIMFSKHASARLNDRNLKLSNSQIRRVEEGIRKASEKGIKDSLVLVDNIALVVNIKNKTVVTAIDNSKDKVYTNIDGAIVV